MLAALARSAEAYGSMAGKLGAQSVRPYPTLNWLFLWSLTADAARRIAHVPLAQSCAASANAAFGDSPEAWNATMVADSSLVVALLNENLRQPGAAGDAAVEQIAFAYEDCLHGALITPKERDAVMRQIAMMGLFYSAHEKAAGVQGPSAGARLQALAQRLTPLGAWVPADRAAPASKPGPPRRRVRVSARTA